MNPFEVLQGAYSLLKGMKVTLKVFLSPSVTCQYPRTTLPLSPRFRGHIKLKGDACRACGLCERTCPTGSIRIESEKVEGGKRKVLRAFWLDFTRCSLCGLCVEQCPQGVLGFSQDYNLASFRKEDFVFELLSEYRRRT